MASLIISSAALRAVSRATSSQARQVVVPFNGTKLSNSAVTSSLVAAPFTGLKSKYSAFPMSRKVDNITSLISSNGGRAKCLATDVSTDIPLAIKMATPSSWTPRGHSIEFKGGDLKNWVEVADHGSNCEKARMYQVIYYVTMEKLTVTSDFTLTVTYPNRIPSTTTKEYTVKPGDVTEIPFEVFQKTDSSGNITFTFDSQDPAKWVGLIINDAVLRC